MANQFLSVSNICKKDNQGFELKSISFTQQKFQKIAIAGETGSGKSTLLKIIAGIASPDTGDVFFKGERVKRIPDEKLIPGHKGIAYLSQHFELQQSLTVEQIMIYANILDDSEAETDDAAIELYKLCRIDRLLKRRTNQLSGGEKQRVALAKLLVSSPRLLLLDEPFSNLDMIHKNTLKSVIHDIGERLGITCIMISHDPLDTLSWADEIFVMHEGNLVQKGTPQKIYEQPTNEYVAGLFGKYNLVEVSVANSLFKLSNIKTDAKRLFIRPENLKIEQQQGQPVGKIIGITYFGSYYEIQVSLAENNILIKTDKCDLAKNDMVDIILFPHNYWHI